MNGKTAILLFSRTAGVEATHKQLHRRSDRNLRLVETMIRRTRRIISKSGLPAFWIDETKQEGQTFGERLFHAANTVFDQGFEQLIVLGNDAPQLRAGDILKAAEKMSAGHSVLGLDQRGGAYLIGLHRAHCQAGLQHLPWQTAELGAALGGWFNNVATSEKALLLRESHLMPSLKQILIPCSLPVVYLRQLQDLNFLADCRSLTFFLLTLREFAVWLNAVLVVERPLIIAALSRSLSYGPSLRGPPVTAS